MIWRAFLDAARAYSARGGDIQAGYIAYSTLLAIFPFLIFATALTGWVIGEERSAAAVSVLFEFAPDYVAEVLSPVVVDLLNQKYNLFTLFILIAIWAAMRAVEAIARAFDAIYGERHARAGLVRMFKSLVAVLVAAIVAVVLGLTILLAPLIVEYVERYTPIEVPEYVVIYRYLFGSAVFYLFLWAMHRFLPSRQVRGFPIWPGALFSTVAWVVMATGLAVYLAYSGNYQLTYGTLAGIVITILFLYFSGAIIIFGAELNVALRDRQEAWQD